MSSLHRTGRAKVSGTTGRTDDTTATTADHHALRRTRRCTATAATMAKVTGQKNHTGSLTESITATPRTKVWGSGRYSRPMELLLAAAKPWAYWIAPLLVVAAVLGVLSVVLQYVFKVVAAKYPKT